MSFPEIPGYEIVDEFPRSGRSVVYKARQISLDRMVVVKTLPPEMCSQFSDVKQFMFEARVAARLKHPNIVQVYDFGHHQELYYFIMEYVSGYTVADWIHRKKRLSEENSLIIAEVVAKALDYAWAREGVIHCDIKPDNVMIDSDGSIKVADLGLAKNVRSLSGDRSDDKVAGTPNYISPEQSEGKPDLDCRTDIYSLGAMLYHMLTGVLPFGEHDPVKAMDMQITDQIEDPQDLNPRLSTNMVLLVETMMAKTPAHRQKNWAEVLQDLGKVMSGEPPTHTLAPDQPSTVRRSPMRGKRPKVKEEHTTTEEETPGFITPSLAKYKKRPQIPPSWITGGAVAAAILICLLFLFFANRNKESADSSRDSLSEPPSPARTEPSPAPRPSPSTPPATVKRDPGPTAPPPPPPLPKPSTDETDNVKKLYEDAMAWWKKHPTEYDKGVMRFQKVAENAKETEYAEMANIQAGKIRVAKRDAVDRIMGDIKEKARNLAVQGKYAEAAHVYKNYSGPMSFETEDTRLFLASQLEKQHEEKTRRIKKHSRDEIDTICTAVASECARGDPSAAFALFEKATKSVMPANARTVAEIKQMLTNACAMPTNILESLKEQQYTETVIDLKSGPQKLVIKNVAATRIDAEKVVKTAGGEMRVGVVFSPDELATRDKIKRLGSGNTPSLSLQKAICIIQDNGNISDAENYFQDTGPPLNAYLVKALSGMKTEKLNTEAEERMARFLNFMDIDAGAAPHQIAESLRTRRYNAKEAEVCARFATILRENYAGSAFLKKYAEVLRELEKVGSNSHRQSPQSSPRNTTTHRDRVDTSQPVPEKRTPRTPDEVVSELMLENSRVERHQIQTRQDDMGRIIGLSVVSPELRSVSAVSALTDLRSATCAGKDRNRWSPGKTTAPLQDLEPFTELKYLRELVVCNTRVEDLDALQGMPLTKIDLGWTKVRDLTPLHGMPLSFLRIDHTSIRDLAPLRGMPLNLIDISGTPIRDISPLRESPVTWINISNTGVRDLSPLQNAKLARVYAHGSKINSLDIVKGMPLVELTINSTDIRDLSPLAGASIEKLRMANTKVRDLEVLKDMPLTLLDIRNTNVRDLEPIRNLPITELYLDYDSDKHEDLLRGMKSLRKVNDRYVGGG